MTDPTSQADERAAALERIFAQQLQVLSGQLQVLQRLRGAVAEPPVPMAVPLTSEPVPAVLAVPPVPAAPEEVPVTEAQRALWIESRMDEDACRAYNEPMVLRLRGRFERRAMEAALQAVVDRHGALRSTLAADGSAWRIAPALAAAIEWTDLSPLDPRRREAAFADWLAAQAGGGLDLEHGPLFRCGVARLGEEEHCLALTIHHIVVDGHSAGVILRELGHVYDAEVAGAPRRLPPPVPFAGQVRRTAAREKALDPASEAYWLAKFADPVPPLDLPADHPRPRVAGYAGARRATLLPPAALEALRALGSSQGATLFVTLLAAWGAMLHRLDGHSEVVVGVPSSDPSATGPIVGYFLELLPLRLSARPEEGGAEPAFRAYLGRVRRELLESQGHRGYPLNRLMERLAGAREAGRPLVSTTFNVDRGGDPPPFHGLETEVLRASTGAARFDLSLSAEEGRDLLVQAELRTELFEPATVERWLAALAGLLAALPAAAGERLGDLPLLREAERHQLLVEWSGTAAALGGGGLLHERFEEQARRRPEATAVVRAGESWTYAELDRRAGELARRLAGLGVAPEARVGILLDSSLERVAALLAVLKAGGAWVPLDPASPRERIERLVADAGVRVVVDGPHPRPLSQPHTRPPGEGGPLPDSLAYVLYTSGSTGTPNGVMVSHRAVTALLDQARTVQAVGPGDRVAHAASLAFDASVLEIFLALTTGAALVVMPAEERRDPEALARTLAEQRVTALIVTPSVLALLPAEVRLPELRSIAAGGEACTADLAARWAPGRRLVHCYGPTEAVIYATAAVLGPRSLAAGADPSIGRPLGGVEAFVLDREGRPLPLGVTGELALGGASLARGYSGRPDRTAERFVPDPFAGRPGARLYRTGDLARWLPTGDLEFLGRIDHQVKIRGVRIELGEIEAALRAHPGVQEAVVLVREGASGRTADRSLAAFAVPRPGAPPAAAELRAHLRRRLSEAMVPAAIVPLEAFPLTAVGKVDRKALLALAAPAAAEPRAAGPVGPIPLRGPVEEQVGAFFAEVLGVPEVGGDSDFFELGGHSLLATQVVSRLRKAYGIALPVRALFELPTPAALAREVEERLGQGLAPAREEKAAAPAGPLELPATEAQRALWIESRLDPGASRAYNEPVLLRFRGPLDLAALRRALQGVADRHAALRGHLAADGTLWHIAPSLKIEIPLTDFSAQSEEGWAAWLRRQVSEPFDLDAAPLWRSAVARLGKDDHVFALVLHHLVVDGRSTSILLQELTALYAAARSGRPADLAPAEPFGRGGPQAAFDPRDEAYWTARFAGEVPALDLPADHPGGDRRDPAGAQIPAWIDPALAADLQALSAARRATPFALFLAAWGALLHRLTGQAEVVVGVPSGDPEAHGPLIGYFLRLLPIRLSAAGDPTFGEYLGRARQALLEGQAHRGYPLASLVRRLGLAGGRPLVESSFNFGRGGVPAFPDLRIEVLRVHTGAARFDLSLNVDSQEGEERILLEAEYRTSRFEAPTVERWLRSFGLLLRAAVADPDRPLADLTGEPLLAAQERHQLLFEWNDTAGEGGPDVCLHELFEEHARRSPGAVALVRGREERTYGELDRRAEALAARLRGLGVGPEVRVGLVLGRSFELAEAILAVLKAGGAWVPVDPASPPERIERLLADAGAGVLMEMRSDGPHPRPLSQPHTLPPGEGRPLPESLAYVLYTSGSTGAPNGVLVTHRGAVRLVRYERGLHGVGPGSRVLQAASPGFDLSVLEVFLALGSGAALVIASDEEVLSPEALAGRIRSARVSAALLTPALLAGLPEGELPSLRAVSVGGESCPADLAARWSRRGRLLHCYGPTEATIDATLARLDGWSGGAVPPIGRPVPGADVHVLGPDLRPVPPGAAGELGIGGAGLARGYLGRPDRTAERFVPHPWAGVAGEPGARLYRTGDRARWLPTGELRFLGRLDEQVKVRGVRVEPGEIEAALRVCPEVEEAAVVVRPERGLAAFVVARDGAAPVPAVLREALLDRLPAALVPASFAVVEALPRTANGKVDRRALERRAASEEPACEPFEAPRGAAEERIAALFAEVLGIAPETVGARSDFFALGGHSLVAAQVLARIQAATGEALPLRALFERPTVAALAAFLEPEPEPAAALPEPAAEPAPPRDPQPLSFAQQRLWFLQRLDPASPAYNLALPLRLEGRLAPAALAAALSEVVRRHEVLRTRYREGEDGPVQLVGPAAPLPLPVIDLRGLPAGRRPAELRGVAGVAAALPFDLERDAPLRAALVRSAEEDWAALLTFHHIAADGWSMGVLVREAAALYAALAEGRPPRLPELALQYADFAAGQRSEAAQGALAEGLAFWRERLAGAPALLELPADRPRPPVRDPRGAVRRLALDPGLGPRVLALARRFGATPFMVLLAAFQALLARYSGQDDLVTGTPVAGRERLETEGLIGFFVNTLPLRADLRGDPEFGDLVGRARDEALEAFAHAGVPFERLVEELAPERSLSHLPLVQVLFAVQNAPLGAVELPGLRMGAIEDPDGGVIAKLDLTLSLEADGTHGFIEYRRDLFDGPTVERMAGHFGRLLAAGVAWPDLRLSEIPLLGEAESAQLRTEWNDTADAELAAAARGRSMPEIFREQVKRTPHAVALICETGPPLTYAALAARAGELAARLRELGAGPERPVGVCLPRTADWVAAVLGVMEAGAVYLPLDPNLPAARRAQLLEDAGAEILISSEGVSGAIGRSGATPLLPANLAYLLYTSGSTGQPKGVAVEHAAAAAHFLAVPKEYGLTPADRVLQFGAAGFDVSLTQILATLFAGATIVLRGDDIPEPAAFSAWLDRFGVTVANIPTAYFHQWVREGGADTAPPRLRLAIPGGEALLPEAARAWMRGLSGARVPLYNAYGPTETVVTATLYTVPADPGLAAPFGAVPIGRPLLGRSAHVIDRHGALAPAGVPGELRLGGLLARGYLDRPALTAERFVPDPFGETPGSRLYRTGDRARLRSDGAIEFLGRDDHQVKIRGFRIELGEIESALAACPGVEAAAVVVRERSGGGERSLLACVVPRAGETPTAAGLRAALRERLPEAMVPAAFAFLDALPFTPNGKLDRRALASLQDTAAEAAAPAAFRGPAEELIAGLFAGLLDVGRGGRGGRGGPVGPDDSFFDRGGHSLLATQLVSRLRAAFGVELSLRTVFETPTVAGLAEAVERARGEGLAAARPPLEPAPRTGPLPLSFAQERLWFLDRLHPGSPAYNVPHAVRLEGALRPAALAAALAEVVRRHEALRTTFAESDGAPVQRIVPPVPLVLPVLDLSALPPSHRAAEARRLAAEEALRPFDLQHGPLLRATLLALSGEEHLALFTMHHIVSDGWSMGVLVREVAALYAAALQGETSPLPELPLQYADFAVWQRRWLQGEALDAQLAFWRERLAGAPPVLELPSDRPRPAVANGRGGMVQATLPAALGQGVAAFARRAGATPFMVLLAAWAALLRRLAGQADLVVGTPVASRSRAELEPLIGFFGNTLALRTRVAPAAGLAALAAQVRERTLDAFAHQELPFERLVEELAPERSLAHAPLFQVLFVLQNNPRVALALPGLTLEPVEPEVRTAKFDLTLFLAELPDGGLGAAFEHSSDLFDAPTPRRWLGHFEALLAAALAAPERPVAALALLADTERQQLLREWGEGEAAGPEDLLVHRLFAAQAARAPERLALVAPGDELSYAEVARRAGRLAAHLAALGVGPDVPVGVCVRRGWEAGVALLAVLEAGGCYLPLDPAYPAERLAFMLADSGAPVLITHRAAAGPLPEPGVRTVWLDEPLPEPPPGFRPPAVHAEHLSYIVYTSGSTGRPKGVALSHRVLSNLIAWQLADSVLPPGEPARTLQFASPSFDASVHEVFATWGAGGTLVTATEEHRRDPRALLAHLAAQRIDRLFLPYVALQALAEAAASPEAPEEPPPLREVQTAGEQLRITPEIAALFRRLPGCVLHNHYGPSETHVVTTWTLAGDPAAWPALPPIGRPLAATSVRVLDAGFEPVPAGVAGELYVGGVMLARGYLGRPDQTAEKFLPDPWSEEPGGRLYRTGDLVRMRPDGALDFLGRIDGQVKIRGFRVEPGEVEAVLQTHPGVREAVVGVRGEGAAKRLAAYVLPSAPAPPPTKLPSDLRAFLRERLPDYLIPAAFVAVEAFPLTPSGKVDRRALAHLPLTGEEAVGGRSAASLRVLDPVEQIVAAVWSDVLGVADVGADDRFFDLGGHSLLATRVVSRLRQALGVELPVRAIFEEPTVAGLARLAGAARAGADGIAAPPILPRPQSEEDPPASFAQERLWFLDRLDPGRPHYHLPVALELCGRLDVAALAASLAEIACRHQTLRTAFPEVAGRPVQRIAPAGPVPLPEIDLTALPADRREAEARAWAAESASRPFDLRKGPVLRALRLRLAAERQLAVLTLHHIAADGWSLGILVRELGALYGARVEGAEPDLPALPVQYADFAVWQRRWLSGAVLERQLDWWREHLAGAPEVAELPLDRPRPAARSYGAGRAPILLPPDLARQVGDLARGQGATPFLVLLAALHALLARLTGQDDAVIGTPVANRNRAETEGLIGFFVNTLALRARTAGAPPFQDLLAQVREAALGAYAHQDLPFERLVEDLQVPRSLSHAPLVQVLFALQNAPVGELELPGLTLEAVDLPPGGSGFDLTLNLSENADGTPGLAGFWGYDPDLFDAPTVRRIAGWFERLLAGAVADPAVPLADLPLLSATEAHQARVEWNDTAFSPVLTPVHEPIAARARQAPGAPAVLFEREALNYAELDARANRLARHLRRRGVVPGVRVGLHLRRGLDLPVALLAVWKAGACHVPLDPTHPDERLAWVAADAGLGAVITWSGAPVAVEAQIRLGADAAGISAESAAPLPSGAGLGAEAYVLYTSGSTGRPKGVRVSHGSLAALLAATQAAFAWRSDDTLASVAPMSFDIFLWELLSPLLAGGACRLLPLDPTLDVEAWAALLPSLTRIHAVPALMRRLLEAARRSPAPAPLRTLFVGGDAVPADLLTQMRRAFPRAELRVLYGPTEATILATSWRVPPGEEPAGSRLGRPLPGVEIRLCDPAGRDVPAGSAGEIWIGGAGVALGYAGKAELTAERFPEIDGKRWYRTGDLARYRPDGDLEFLGRTDLQVKVRGVRIEPGEIEAALAELPEVAEAAVVPRDDLPGGRALAAWIVAAPGQSPDPDRLRETLRGRLPEAYLPAVVAAVEALPLTAHGKLDRKALARLPLPAQAEAEAAGPAAAPLTPTEELLAVVGSGLLGRDPARLHPADGFFAQGGHSLLAMQLVSRIRELFGVDLPLREIFEAPTLAAMARRVEAATRSSAGVPEAPLVPAPRGPGMPLSFGQERLWFLDRLAPGESIYNISMALKLGGQVSQPALAAALAGLARRHEALRTTFGSRDGQPFQRIAEPGQPALPRIDLTALPAGPREAEALRLAAEDAALPFDLERGPLWRAALVALEEERQALLLTLHHIVSDGWSMDILFRETTELYAAALQEREPSLAPLPVQYADYAVWQRGWLRGPVLQAQLAAWRERLAGAPEILDLPLDRPRGVWLDPRGGSERMVLPAAEAQAVRALAHERGTTLFMVLLAAFAAVIGRWTGGDDVPVGTPVANRNRPEIEGLIGFFVNTLVLRADLAGDPAFGDLLERARETALHAYAHQDLPFERLVEELQPERSLGATPLFQVMLSLENQPVSRVERPGLQVERLPREERAATFDLVLGVAESGETLIGGFSYRASLFDAPTAGRLRSTFQTFLAAAARQPGRRLSDLPLLDEAERHQLLAEWSGGDAFETEPVPVHVRIARQAARTPDAPAVLAAEESLTFGELDRRAAGLAARLLELGLGPESRVGLAVGRSAGLLAGMLGIWKAGAAWVPLDPAQPAERLAFLLQDAGVSVLVAEHAVEIGEGREIVLLDTLEREGAVPEISEPGLAAYVLYTSGSTGRPKGVVVEHRSLSRYLAWVEEALGGEALPATSSAAFDASLKQLLAPLAAGRPVHLLSEAEAEPEPLLRKLAEDGLGAWNGVPSLWSFVLDLIEEGGPRPERLRRLLLGGEALPEDLLERTRRALPGVEVWNLYGPTEATANATAARLEPGEGVHLGKPVAGARAYVLGFGGDPAPLGAFGELALAGGGLARGYLGRPALTAERFLPDPFAGEPGARLYRTGDRVRRRADGRLEYRGRIDHQIKLRGIRVELGEIEAALCEHPAVKEAAVAALPTERGDLRLAAFVVAPGAGADLAKDLRARLRGRLAAPLVPSDIAVIESLPRTPTGKLDRPALARLQPHEEERPYEAPRDSVEQLLAEIWQELLGVERVGLRDNFFLLGGHSLLATRLAVRIRRELGIELPLRRLFEAADLEALAQEILALQLSHQSEDGLATLLAELEGLSEEDALTLLGEGGGDE